MRSCMFLSTVDVPHGRSAYFFLRLLARPFLGSVGEVDSPHVFFLPILAWLVSVHYFFVLQGVSQKLGYLIALASQLCPIWTIAWGIRSVLEGPFIFRRLWRFQRGFQSGQGLFPIAPAWSGFSVPSNIFKDLCYYFWVFKCLTARLAALLSGGSCLSLSFPMMKVAPKFLEGLICSASGIFSPSS